VDDHPAVREGLAIRISRQADLEVCGEAADIADALRLVASAKPDVAIIDISLKTGNGIDLIKRIKARFPEVRMLVWSMYDESLYAERALRAGALGYINKEHATDKIIDGLRRVLAGKVYLSESMAQKIITQTVAGEDIQGKDLVTSRLSDRELEVFQLIGSGHSTLDVAKKMKVSPKTVETYRVRIKEKLNVSTSAELMQRAVKWVIEKV
jgi:DNA-binding NarL/FixJ family response regulator